MSIKNTPVFSFCPDAGSMLNKLKRQLALHVAADEQVAQGEIPAI